MDDGSLPKETNKAVAEMWTNVLSFDIDKYFASLATNLMVRLATHLLEGYLGT